MKIATAFSSQGTLAKAISGFQPRPAQIELAEAIATNLQDKGVIVAEAGTGTGKTFAYLVPLLLAEGKCIVSTGTKALQEQLFHRDLPTVHQALSSDKTIALLKGRGNYLCRYRLELHLKQPDVVPGKSQQEDLIRVRRWANTTRSGDLGELIDVAEDSAVRPLVTSTVDNCLGRDCPDYEDCYLAKARRRAMDADLVVINHHLFFADLVLKDTGFGELLPQIDHLIFDEAHQLPDIASNYFGQSLSTRQLRELCRDVQVGYRTEARDTAQLGRAADKVDRTAQQLRALFAPEPSKGNWRQWLSREDVAQAVARLSEDLKFLYDVLKSVLGRGKVLDQCFERALDCKQRLDVVCDLEATEVSLWYETTPRHLSMNVTPLSVSEPFKKHLNSMQVSAVFTSATLKVAEGFTHFNSLLGLQPAQELALESPFDYQHQALLCVPGDLSEPDRGQPTAEQYSALVTPLIKAAKGRTFLLFTSHRMMQQVALLLSEQLQFPVLMQGQSSKRVLLEQFVKRGNAVLCATASFWEGVDVRGQALSCVVIDKLPFGAPDDPLLAARIDDCRRKGQDPFATVQLPQAVIALKQGAGRLIRSVDDRGALVICDPRLTTRQYGKVFLQSLPDMPRTRNVQRVTEFLSELAEPSVEPVINE